MSSAPTNIINHLIHTTMDKTKLLHDMAEILNAHDTRFTGVTFEEENGHLRITTEDEDFFLDFRGESFKHKETSIYAPTIARLQMMGATPKFIRKVNSYLHKPAEQTTLNF